ncbi:hypothetical protein CFP56_041823 [Quercus suber]|uniref:Uncharacterized protein n=1 Tax=Quercus suber TaxID=58331 RepID=A0AAW0IVH0_QUESU
MSTKSRPTNGGCGSKEEATDKLVGWRGFRLFKGSSQVLEKRELMRSLKNLSCKGFNEPVKERCKLNRVCLVKDEDGTLKQDEKCQCSLFGMVEELRLASHCKITNLRILDLKASHNLEALLDGTVLLKKLSHLDISECYLFCLPKEIASLSELQVLKELVVDPRQGSKLLTVAPPLFSYGL